MGGTLGRQAEVSLPCRGGKGLQRACYPAHLKRALEPAVLGCVKHGNFPPLMYNLELTAKQSGAPGLRSHHPVPAAHVRESAHPGGI